MAAAAERDYAAVALDHTHTSGIPRHAELGQRVRVAAVTPLTAAVRPVVVQTHLCAPRETLDAVMPLLPTPEASDALALRKVPRTIRAERAGVNVPAEIQRRPPAHRVARRRRRVHERRGATAVTARLGGARR